MDKIITCRRSDLEAMVKAATGGKDAATWIAETLAKIAGMVKVRPAVYRSFGPWWWPVKAQLVAGGLMTGLGDVALVEAITTGDAATDLVAALAFHGFSIDEQRDSNVFSVDTESGDLVDYLLDDDEMESLIVAR